jgi:hypothetical protein
MAQEDPEIKAMGTIAGALVDLDKEAQARVLDWAARRFDVSLPSGGSPSGRGRREGRNGGGGSDLNPPEDVEFQDFVDLFDGAGPRTDAERALVGGYWFQIIGGSSDFQSQEVNTALKDVGHGVGNITQALDQLQNRSPALVRQVAKSGRTRQARKKYKLTTAGTAAVRRMLAGQDGEAES